MHAPHTYTCEDTVEVNCHSGIFTLRMILSLILKKGACLAEPGEFTKRAFLNGRIDLSQAESVLKLIKARSEEGVKMAARNVQGNLMQEIISLRSEIMDVLVHIEAALDFPEELDESLTSAEVKELIQKLIDSFHRILQGADRGRAYQEGIDTAIVGKPNVGKSSLLNALLRQQRAIVHEVPGTTRDLLEGYLYLAGYPIRIIDTAGIRKTADPVEQEGISRTRDAADRARLLLIVLDGSSPWDGEDEALVRMIREDQSVIIVINKSDLPQKISTHNLKKRFKEIPVLHTAVINNQGVQRLEEEIVRLLDRDLGHGGENPVLISLRHEEVARQALSSIERASATADIQPLELVSLDLREAWHKLGEITGEAITDELLDRIFSQFCLGK
jgi:tRNA modification GTPase